MHLDFSISLNLEAVDSPRREKKNKSKNHIAWEMHIVGGWVQFPMWSPFGFAFLFWQVLPSTYTVQIYSSWWLQIESQTWTAGRSPHVWIEKLKVVKAPGTVKCRLVPNYMLNSIFADEHEGKLVGSARRRASFSGAELGQDRLKSLMGVTRHSDSTNYVYPMYYTLLPFLSSRLPFGNDSNS